MKRRHKHKHRVFWRAALSGLLVWARRAGDPRPAAKAVAP